MSSNYRYFVEGECEKKFLKSFMYEKEIFVPGKIEVINFNNEKISKPFARTIKKDCHVVIVFDTDIDSLVNMEHNISLLKEVSQLEDKNIILVPSIRTFEDELVYSCSEISDINQLLSTRSLKEFKKKFIAHKDITSKLDVAGFMIEKMWSRNPKGVFGKYKNNVSKIKC